MRPKEECRGARGLHVDGLCSICKKEEETVNHVLIECEPARYKGLQCAEV